MSIDAASGLRAFGEAIAEAVRLRMILEVMRGQSIRMECGDNVYLQLDSTRFGACPTRLKRVEPARNDTHNELRSWDGDAEDHAVEAVSALLEEHRREEAAQLARVVPVLQWTHGERESTATLGRWRLSATDGAWSVGVVTFEWVGPVDGSRGPTTRASNCSAAETSLRSLGVMFTTEDGQ